ncbi:jg8366 [Pararge aegeria aegeria]|uniref:Jg8366 protein n=1 Tax=Pararge aegeria aegeria TaxID=348720 RepID=A0A8S4R0Y0_9NEOP|nr:jg8366 [Pararge aegeria aegeria]
MLCNFSNIFANIKSPPTIDGRPLNQVDRFKYLGSVINTRANTEDGIQSSRINTGWLNFRCLTGVLCDAKLPITLKGTVYKRPDDRLCSMGPNAGE